VNNKFVRFGTILTDNRIASLSKADAKKQMKLSTSSKTFLGFATLLVVVFAFTFFRDSAEDMSPTSMKATYSLSTETDPLHDILLLVKNDDMDTAIEKFMAKGEVNLIATTSLKEFKISEAEFVSLGTFFNRSQQAVLQEKLIQRVTEIKKLARMLRDRAIAAESRGDTKTADAYVRSINHLGKQLRNSNTVLVFQQTGMALESFALP
jgi:hypothetical protein